MRIVNVLFGLAFVAALLSLIGFGVTCADLTAWHSLFVKSFVISAVFLLLFGTIEIIAGRLRRR